MYRSLNFLVTTKSDLRGSVPRGYEVTHELKNEIASLHEISRELDNWRDVEWDFCFLADKEEYTVTTSCIKGKNQLLIQVSSAYFPNWLMRFFGYLPSATERGFLRRRSEINQILSGIPDVVKVLFAFDQFPEESQESDDL